MGPRGGWPTGRGPLTTGRGAPAEREVSEGRSVSLEGGTWLIELGTSKGVIQAEFMIAATPLVVAAHSVGRGKTAIYAVDSLFPGDSSGSLRPRIDD